MKFVKEINLGHIVATTLLVANLFAMYYGLKSAVADEAHKRETQDIKLVEQSRALAEQNRQTLAILREMRDEMRLNTEHRITDEARWED